MAFRQWIAGRAPRRLPRAWRGWPRQTGLLWALLALVWAGCATGNGGSPGGRKEAIEALHLFGLPVAVNMDAVPGPDGVAVRVYASSRKSAAGLPISSGRLEILMFDGVLKEKAVSEPPPLRTWSYPADQLKKQRTKTSLGTGYIFALQWGETRPVHSHISIIVRYVSRNGAIIQSAPSTISLGVK